MALRVGWGQKQSIGNWSSGFNLIYTKSSRCFIAETQCQRKGLGTPECCNLLAALKRQPIDTLNYYFHSSWDFDVRPDVIVCVMLGPDCFSVC